MEKFSAWDFFAMGTFLGEIQTICEGSKAGHEDDVINKKNVNAIAKWLRELQNKCKMIGLNVSADAAGHAVIVVKRKKPSFTDLGHALEHLKNNIVWEMKRLRFFHMPNVRTEFLDKKEMFGPDVSAKFATVEYDLVEAGNCYAMGRSTATVFHLMRVMEVGVQQFGTTLGVALVDQKVWQNILDEINREIKKLPAKDPRTVEMTQVAANLYAVKLAWRNEVMHPKDTYTLEEAGNLISQVKIFMQQLAKIL